MKKVFLVAFMFFALAGFSQKNAVKLGISGVNYGDFFLSYERVINLKSSVNVTAGYWNLNAGIFNFDNLFNAAEGLDLQQYKSGLHASADYRFYVGKHESFRGFYIGPYLRYWNQNFVLLDEIEGDNFDVNTNIWSIGAGFQMGYHWVINDYISIDWYFVGLGVESILANFVYVTETSNFDYSTIEDDFVNVFEGFDYFQDKIKTGNSAENMTAKLPFIAPGFKTGLTIGVAFGN
ncbi:MAG: DUF3575 domain-containing protein [Prolixibacteraceae bacterium]|nr:DUF3575 domain-containing protein [Prolixibacteraceae bacterium]